MNTLKRFLIFIKRQPPARIIALGFALAILLGAALLKLPVSVRDTATVSWVDALFTSTSAVCVTGLIAVDSAESFTPFGQAVLVGLIQIGGLGVTSIGMGLALAAGRRISLRGRTLVREALNVDSLEGMIRLIRAVLFFTLCFELGAWCSVSRCSSRIFRRCMRCGSVSSTRWRLSTTPVLTFWAVCAT